MNLCIGGVVGLEDLPLRIFGVLQTYD